MPVYTGSVFSAVRTFNIEDASGLPTVHITNSNASFSATAIAGNVPYVLPNISVLEGDGVTNTYPSAVNINTSQRTFSFTVTLKAGSQLEMTRQILFKGTVKLVALTNVASYTVKKVSGSGSLTTVTLPFTVLQNDIVQVAAVPTDSSMDTVLEFTAFYDVVTNSNTLPSLGGDGRYLYVLNTVDQTVSVIDTGSNTVTATVTLPSGKAFSVLAFRHVDKSVWVFGTLYRATIDANPASGTFNTVASHGAVVSIASAPSVCYDYIDDQFFLGNISNNIYVYNPNTNGVTNLKPTFIETGPRGRWYRYLQNLNAVYIGDEASGQIIIKADTFDTIYGFSAIAAGGFGYCRANGKFYLSGVGQVKAFDSWPIRLYQTITAANFRNSAMSFVNSLSLLLGYSVFANPFGVVNTSTNTYTGGVTKTSPDTNENGTRQIIYSPYSQRAYAQGLSSLNVTTGVTRVHILNPALALASMYLGYITVGNMKGDSANDGYYWTNEMCLNILTL